MFESSASCSGKYVRTYVRTYRTYTRTYVRAYVFTCLHAWRTADRPYCSSTHATHARHAYVRTYIVRTYVHTYVRTYLSLYQHAHMYVRTLWNVCTYVRIMITQGGGTVRRRQTLSGLSFKQQKTFTRPLMEGYPVTMLNYGKTLIIKVDDDAIRFIANGFVDLLAPTLLASDDAQCHTPEDERSSVRFDRDTPNFPGKVCWNVTGDKWIVTYKNKAKEECHVEVGESGESFVVPEGLSRDDRAICKYKKYREACVTWNANDKSTRARIMLPPEVIKVRRPAVPDAVESSSQELDEPELVSLLA